MADNETVTEPTPEVDPIEQLLKDHTAKLKEISAAGFQKAQQLCEESLDSIKKHSGMKSAVLEKALTALGITPNQ